MTTKQLRLSRDQAVELARCLFQAQRVLDAAACSDDWSLVRQWFHDSLKGRVLEAIGNLAKKVAPTGDAESNAKFDWSSSTRPRVWRVLLRKLFGRWTTACYVRPEELRLFRLEMTVFFQIMSLESRPAQEMLNSQRMTLFDCEQLLAGICCGVREIDRGELAAYWKRVATEDSRAIPAKV